MTSDDRFPCQRCAACCSLVGGTALGKSLALPDGSCRHLDKQTNLCSIYEHRPSFCRVDEYYEKKLRIYHVTQSISSPKSCLLRNASRQAKGKTKSGKNIASHTKRAVTKLSRILSQPFFLPILKCLLVHNKALYLTRSDLGISNTSIAFSAVHA